MRSYALWLLLELLHIRQQGLRRHLQGLGSDVAYRVADPGQVMQGLPQIASGIFTP